MNIIDKKKKMMTPEIIAILQHSHKQHSSAPASVPQPSPMLCLSFLSTTSLLIFTTTLKEKLMHDDQENIYIW